MQAQAPAKKQIALMGTVVFRHSHAQHFIDRFLLGYSWDGQWRTPDVELVSLYIDQFPKEDLVRAIAKRHGVPLATTIPEALTMGTSKLAVDGVVIIGEHGKYPQEREGAGAISPVCVLQGGGQGLREERAERAGVQRQAPLDPLGRVRRDGGRLAKRLGFPFLAGSSLPVTWRLPAVDMPWALPWSRAFAWAMAGWIATTSTGWRRPSACRSAARGARSGSRACRPCEGPRCGTGSRPRRRPDRSSSRPSRAATPCRWRKAISPTASASNGPGESFREVLAYFIEHVDGFATTLFMMPVIQDFTYAGLISGTNEVISCQMYLPMPGRGSSTADFFNPLVRHIERMIVEGQAPYPVERTLLTSGMMLSAVESLHRGGERVETPEWRFVTRAPESRFTGGPEPASTSCRPEIPDDVSRHDPPISDGRSTPQRPRDGGELAPAAAAHECTGR